MRLSDNGMLRELSRVYPSSQRRFFLSDARAQRHSRCSHHHKYQAIGLRYQSRNASPLSSSCNLSNQSRNEQNEFKATQGGGVRHLVSAKAREREHAVIGETRLAIPRQRWSRTDTLSDYKTPLGPRSDEHTPRPQHGVEPTRNITYWERKFLYRKRVYGDKAAKRTWEQFKRIGVQDAPSLYDSKALLQGLIAIGFHSLTFLKDLCCYLNNMHKQKGEVEPEDFGIYKSVLGHVLDLDPSAAPIFHEYLKCFPPTRHDLLELAIRLRGNCRGREAFERLCFDLTCFEDMYDHIVPGLCARELYEEAFEWHRCLTANGHKPASSRSVESLVKYLADSGRRQASKEIMRNIATRNPPSVVTLTVDQRKHELRVMLDNIEKESPISKIPEKVLSDEFCARLFATRFFSIETIISGLHILQTRTIGPHSVREILLRIAQGQSCNAETVLGSLELISRAGISLGHSLFCRLVQKLAKEGNSLVLYDIAICDQHPDVLEDWVLQETLLAQYEARGDARQVQRTLAVVLMDVNREFESTKMMNVLLRSALTRGDDDAMMQLLEAMRQRDLIISSRSLSWMYKKFVPQRLKRKLPVTRNLKKLISVWQNLMVAGTDMPPKQWDDALRTLLLQGSLQEYEALSIWLARWYTDCKFRLNATNRFSRSRSLPEQRLTKFETNFQDLFSLQVFHEIVLWGFFHGSSVENLKRPLMGSTRDERAASLAQHPTLWGLRLLVSLKAYGVDIPDYIAGRVCQQRLRSMFSEGFHAQHINQHIRKHRLGSIEEYIAAMELIWGPTLFARIDTVEAFGEGTVQKANGQWRYRSQRLRKFLERTDTSKLLAKGAKPPLPLKRIA